MQWKPNATVAAVVEDNGRFLLVEEEIAGKLVFNQPAGHLEQGENLLEAVKREVLEETAWEFEPTALVGVYLYPSQNDPELTYLRFCFAGHCTNEHKDKELDEGIVRAAWLTTAELEQEQQRMRSPMVMECINDYLDGQRYPLAMLHDQIS